MRKRLTHLCGSVNKMPPASLAAEALSNATIKFRIKMHQNALGGRALPVSAGEASRRIREGKKGQERGK